MNSSTSTNPEPEPRAPAELQDSAGDVSNTELEPDSDSLSPIISGPRPSASDLLGGTLRRQGMSPAGNVLGGLLLAATLYVLSIGPAANYCNSQLNYTRAGRTFTIGIQGNAPVRDSLPQVTYRPVLWACAENTYVYNSINGWLNLWGHSLAQGEIVLNAVTSPARGSGSVNNSITPSVTGAGNPETSPAGPVPYPTVMALPSMALMQETAATIKKQEEAKVSGSGTMILGDLDEKPVYRPPSVDSYTATAIHMASPAFMPAFAPSPALVLVYLYMMGPAQYLIYDTIDYTNGRLSGTVYTATQMERTLPAARFECAIYQPVLWACIHNRQIYDLTDRWLQVWGSKLGHIADGQSKGIILTGYVNVDKKGPLYHWGPRFAPNVTMISGFSSGTSLKSGVDEDYEFPQMEWIAPHSFHLAPWDTGWKVIMMPAQTLWKAVEQQHEKERLLKSDLTLPISAAPPLDPWSLQPETAPYFSISPLEPVPKPRIPKWPSYMD